MRRIFLLVISLAIIFGLTITSYATLIDRGGGLIYDTVLNITWLKDANYAETTGYDDILYGFDTGGKMKWSDAMYWVDQLVYGGYDNWRLPSALNEDGTISFYKYYVTGSEMGHMYYINLGNLGLGTLNNSYIDGETGLSKSFDNLKADGYWFATELDLNPNYAMYFGFYSGFQAGTDKNITNFYAWPVHDGDIGTPVPEPSTMLLLGSGLIGLAGYGRKKFFKK